MKKKKLGVVGNFIIGGILVVISLVIIIVFLTLPTALKDLNLDYIGWVSLIFVVVGVILFFVGMFFLKKGNYLRLKNK